MKKNYLNVIIYVLLVIIFSLITYLLLYNDKKEISNVILNKNKIQLLVGEKELLEAKIIPDEINEYKLIWKSNNTSVASVDENGIVNANDSGFAIITVEEEKTKKSDSCEIEVLPLATPTPTITPTETPEPSPIITPTPTPISVQSITVDKKDIIMAVGASDNLTVTINPSDAFNKEVTWTSSNPNVVNISSSGKITAISSGKATIKITSKDGNKTTTSNINVIDRQIFDQRNDALIEYLKEPSSNKIIKTYRNSCSKITCTRPKNYTTSLTDNINIYKYNMNDNSKTLIQMINAKDINYYIEPNSTYYLESKTDSSKIEIISIIGNVRMVNLPRVDNVRDLGGYNADGGTVKYGKIFRSATTDAIKSLSDLNALGIKEIVDLRKSSEIKSGTIVKDIRKNISIAGYNVNKSSNTWKAVNEIIKTVITNKNVLFHCAIGRDRTGTVAYMLEGILGVSLDDRSIDYELSYYHTHELTRTSAEYKGLINKVNVYGMTNYEQERFINWYLEQSENKENALNLINNFRKIMIDGNPHEYKLINGNLTLVS